MERYAIIVAAGTGSRMGLGMPKQYLMLEGKTVLQHSLEAFVEADPTTHLIVVAHPDYYDALYAIRQSCGVGFDVVAGGVSRSASVKNGLEHVPDDALVAVHDAARPWVTAELINQCYAAALEFGAATAAVPAKESLRHMQPDGTSRAVNRKAYWVVQTPQAFKAGLIKRAYTRVALDGSLTDDASVVEAAGHAVHLVEGSYANVKITTRADLNEK